MILSACFFLLGWVIAVVLTPWVVRICQRGYGMDDPNETRKTQVVPIPRLGGAPIVIAALVGLALNFWIDPKPTVNWGPILTGSVLMYGLGFWDDLKPLGARKKLLGQILIASLVWWMGLSIDKVSYPGARWSVQLYESSYFVTVFWLIAVPNIINLIDGFDGLASGLGLVLSTTLGIVAIHNEQLEVAYYAFTVAGALMGFLIFNFPPARIYLGDGGAYLIGFSIAALSLSSSNKGSVAAVLLVTIVALGIPILDTTFALLRRAMRGYPIFHADDEHFPPSARAAGPDKASRADGLLRDCGRFFAAGVEYCVEPGTNAADRDRCGLYAGAAGAALFHQVGTWKDFLRKARRNLSRRDHVRYALLQAQVLELELERCRSAEEFWAVFEITLKRVGFTQPGEAEAELTVAVRFNGSTPWTLYACRTRGSSREWQRLAECFRPVYARAKAKWQTN
jgi:UDP-GlcNAc:undecaprenyl-phosphate GlcNAc-1-phosphate transferase